MIMGFLTVIISFEIERLMQIKCIKDKSNT